MRIVLIGGDGQLGTALKNRLEQECIPLDHSAIEITDAESVRELFEQHHPDCVINTAAYNLVDQAENEPEQAYRVNALGPRLLARECGERNLRMVHIGTDYVFGGDLPRRIPYSETDSPFPQGVYASSKLAGEYFVRALCPRHFVVRTCGLFGNSSSLGKGNFVRTMLRVGKEKQELNVVGDQHCTPTSARDLAEAISRLINTEAWGLQHATNRGATNWAAFAREIFRLAEMSVKVHPIPSREYASPAQRPGYSVLDCRKLTGLLQWEMPTWDVALKEYLREIL